MSWEVFNLFCIGTGVSRFPGSAALPGILSFPCMCSGGPEPFTAASRGRCRQADSAPHAFALRCVPLHVCPSLQDSGFQERSSGRPPMAGLDFTHCYSEVQKQCNFSVSADLIWLSSFHSPNFSVSVSSGSQYYILQTFNISRYSPPPPLISIIPVAG